MNKTVKVIFGACIVFILAAGAFFAGSTYYDSKQKDAQLVLMKKESSTKESKYLSSKIKDKKIKDKQESKKSSSKKASKSDNQTEVSQTQADTTEQQSQNSALSSSIQTAIDPADMDSAQRAEYDAFSARAATADGPIGQAGPVDENGDPIYDDSDTEQYYVDENGNRTDEPTGHFNTDAE